MNIRKYFWDLNEEAANETGKILENPFHPKYLQRIFTLLSRLDEPKKLFSIISREQFIATWPRVRRYWRKMGQAADFLAWWDAVYDNMSEKRRITRKLSARRAGALQETGRLIRSARLEKGLSQAELSQKAGMKQPGISSLEKGEKNVTLETLIKVCRVLGIKQLPIFS